VPLPDSSTDILSRFSAATAAWFRSSFAEPTAAQCGAWAAISADQHSLIVAPTGSGKTLAAFLWALDHLATEPAVEPAQRCRVVYVSPMKALAVDVERNLRAPLAGITQAAHRLELPVPDVTVAVRSGDTPADERRRFATRPADILITTPESLYLLLTSQAREALRGVRTVIVDEVHAVAGSKRGAHLALSLERLDQLLERPVQRIGLSATVRPVAEVARFLGGAQQVTIVQPPTTKVIELEVVVPVEDMSALGESTGEVSGSASGEDVRTSIWPPMEERIVDLIEAHRSTIVFANSRRLAERLCGRLNEIAEERRTGQIYPEPSRLPAQIIAASGVGVGANPEIARAHHGSVSKEQRGLIEEALKAGRLPAVVATSSLELGIDMGAVDLVIQVESPPSVASGLQRIGRGGHQVGAVSRGVIFPKYRGDLVQTAVVAERMRSGAIESLHVPRNPLDVLAQHVVSMVSMEPWDVTELTQLIRRAAPFSTLPDSAIDAVLDMLAGRYPSDDFAELRPRLVWDRDSGILTGRPGAQRLAVTSGGTIPDRGLFGVFLVGEKASRVGELDEEMVYESRVGDVFMLGSTSWRIEDITHDRVLVSPAPGQPGRLPFWKGDTQGRPVELGRAIGAFHRELSSLTPVDARHRATTAGLDSWAADNLLAYLSEQQAATGCLPDDRTIVVERFRDELGDWRVAIHSPFGAPVHAPWALAIAARLRERYGLDAQTMHSDDGIVLRLPETDGDDSIGGGAPSGELAIFDPADIDPIIRTEVGGSALFAARFRECAARALLLPRRNPGKRSPLWQQRQRSAQLLAVASEHSTFPIILETMRECLQDVFDVPGLVELMNALDRKSIRLVEVETSSPSPFARSLLFGYVAAFLYEGDSPLAERRAQALAVDTTLLAELLGQVELRDLLDLTSVEEVEQELQRLSDERRTRGLEGIADLVRELGPLTSTEITDRTTEPDRAAGWLAELETTRRLLSIRLAEQQMWIAVEDAGRLRDALGVPLPTGIADAFLQPVRDPLGDLISRFARTHGPFAVADVAQRFGIGTAVVADVLGRLAAAGRVTHGELRPGGVEIDWCDTGVLRRLRRRSLAALRQEVEAVPAVTLARFLTGWQQLDTPTRGLGGVLTVIEQLHGVALPASAWETLVLPSRVAGYEPGQLDELCAAGEVMWAGHGALPAADGWVSLSLADAAPLVMPAADPVPPDTPLHRALLTVLDGGAAWFFRTLSERLADATGTLSDATITKDAAIGAALWDLVWAGIITNDTLAPLRAHTATSRKPASRSRQPRTRYLSPAPRLNRASLSLRQPGRSGPAHLGGRWSLLPARESDPTLRLHSVADALLHRHGVVTRPAVMAERVTGGFSAIYRVLKAFEEAGKCRRGYFVDGLGAAQFATSAAVDRLRIGRDTNDFPAIVLAACDPANPYGAALAWPERPSDGGRHKPGRKAGAVVVLVHGVLVLYVERGGKSLLSWELTDDDDSSELTTACRALASAVRTGALGKLTVERTDGVAALTSPLGRALTDAGFHPTPRGLRLRGP
jgi:ATP-dependent helicase Lhr and Lhr-like helicase